jgi:riboflavin synthase
LRLHTTLAGELRGGDSLAVNGVCLTIVGSGGGHVEADVSPETSRVTTLGSLGAGTLVNLERPLRADARLGGHVVQGHVDARGTIAAIEPYGDCRWLSIAYPPELAPYLVPKGSIAVDGISLTVASLAVAEFGVQIVPFTWEHTNLAAARQGDPVNLECDIVGKYVVRLAELAGLRLPAPTP